MGRDLGGTLYKLLGFFAIIQAVVILPQAMSVVAIRSDTDHIVINRPLLLVVCFIPILILLVGGLWLVLRSEQLGARQSTSAENPPAAPPGAHVRSSLLCAAGLVLVGLALGDLPAICIDLAWKYSMTGDFAYAVQNPAMGWGRIAGPLLQMALGAFLVWKNFALVTSTGRNGRARRIAGDAQCPHCGSWFTRADYREDAVEYRCENCNREIPRELIRSEPGASEPGE